MGQGEKVRYVYNGLGQRMLKMDSGSTIVYHYDSLNRLIAETDQHGGPIRPDLRSQYIWLDHELIAVGESGAMYYVHTNHRNQPHLASDAEGEVAWRGVSTPFGSTSIDNGQGGPSGLRLNLRLPGQYFDAETGFHHNYHRDYSPDLGRYLQTDPIGLNGGMNLYGYCGNDPVNKCDVWGLVWKKTGVDYHVGHNAVIAITRINDLITALPHPVHNTVPNELTPSIPLGYRRTVNYTWEDVPTDHPSLKGQFLNGMKMQVVQEAVTRRTAYNKLGETYLTNPKKTGFWGEVLYSPGAPPKTNAPIPGQTFLPIDRQTYEANIDNPEWRASYYEYHADDFEANPPSRLLKNRVSRTNLS